MRDRDEHGAAEYGGGQKKAARCLPLKTLGIILGNLPERPGRLRHHERVGDDGESQNQANQAIADLAVSVVSPKRRPPRFRSICRARPKRILRLRFMPKRLVM